MASLKVLLVGDNPNIILLASRFQLANSVDFYHISDSISNQYEIETYSYGLETFRSTNHFNSIDQLVQNPSYKNILFDLIVLSATSLQQLSTISSQLSSLITNTTTIFVESTGSVQLEPFVRMSIDSKHRINVLSFVSDLDIRHIESNNINRFKQFGFKDRQYTIYLGDSSSENYGSTTQNFLTTFQRLFKKLFPNESIDLCGFSPKQFLKVQWELSLTQICFDPLLILLEEVKTQSLPNLILAKPLISGLVAEVTTLINKMGIELDPIMNSESKLLKYWQSLYPDHMPPLVYNFVNRTSLLNTDLIWLQTILLADDQNVKTPYLEFLYSMMLQFQKINNGDSKWFTRNSNDTTQGPKIDETNGIISDLKIENQKLGEEIALLKEKLKSKDRRINDINIDIQRLNKQLDSVNKDHMMTINNYESQIENLNRQINDLTLNQAVNQTNRNNSNNKATTTTTTTTPHNDTNNVVNKNSKNIQNSSSEYTDTGTPDLNDLQDVIIYGVSYGDSPVKNNNDTTKNNEQQQNQLLNSSSSSSSSQNFSTSNNRSSNTSQSEMDESRLLQERELDLKRKELELQERELELKKRALRQQQQQFVGIYSNMNFPNNQLPHKEGNQVNSRNKPFNQVPQKNHLPNMRQNRDIYGTSSAPASTLNFNEPISSGVGYTGNSIQPQHTFPHAIKPTSRKNRASNLPNLRNPSNTNMDAFQNNMMNKVPTSVNNKSRLNSLPGQNMNYQTRLKNTQQNIHRASFNNMKSTVRANTMQHLPSNFNQQHLQQYQQVGSSSVDMYNGGNVSMNSGTQPQLRSVGKTSNVKMVPKLQQQVPQSKQNEPRTQQASNVTIQLNSNTLTTSTPNAVESSPNFFVGNNTTESVGDGKSKIKKFGLFKKKDKT